MNLLPNAALSLACGVLGAAGVHAITPQPDPPRLASVDIARLVKARIETLRAADANPAQAEHAATVWGEQLAAATEQLASDENVVILVAPSVVAGAIDVTATVAQRLAERTQRGEE